MPRSYTLFCGRKLGSPPPLHTTHLAHGRQCITDVVCQTVRLLAPGPHVTTIVSVFCALRVEAAVQKFSV